MQEERRAACAEKLKRLDEKQQQQQTMKPSSPSDAQANSPSPSLSASASSPNISQPPSPCVDIEEPPLSPAQGSSATLGKPGWAEESGSSWSSQANAGPYQDRPLNQSPISGPILAPPEAQWCPGTAAGGGDAWWADPSSLRHPAPPATG
ncbi:hypothetical protein DPX16_18899 [Anabarilius grahami]|uniref:Uncharacterized protein n=1 Tax=Anabarilius grahami TaxID=495550 RepID=A0A3N0YMI5_ANAGA|nr:hypothetical protein DPX16_18899 [Anabarilius grahami]